MTISKRPRKTRKHRYRLEFHPAALDEWKALDGSVKQPLKKLLEKRLDHPRVPGGALTGDLLGCYKIKWKKHGVRLIYRIAGDALIVMVMAIDRREDGAAYQSAGARVTKLIASLKKTPKP